MRAGGIRLGRVELTRTVAVCGLCGLLLSNVVHAQRPAHPKPAGAKPPAPAAPKVTVPPLEFQLQGEFKIPDVRIDCGDANTLPVSWHGSLKPDLSGSALELAGLVFSVDGHVPFASVLRLPHSVRCAWTPGNPKIFLDLDIQENPQSELSVIVILRNPLATGIVAKYVDKMPVTVSFANGGAPGRCTMTHYDLTPKLTRTQG